MLGWTQPLGAGVKQVGVLFTSGCAVVRVTAAGSQSEGPAAVTRDPERIPFSKSLKVGNWEQNAQLGVVFQSFAQGPADITPIYVCRPLCGCHRNAAVARFCIAVCARDGISAPGSVLIWRFANRQASCCLKHLAMWISLRCKTREHARVATKLTNQVAWRLSRQTMKIPLTTITEAPTSVQNPGVSAQTSQPRSDAQISAV